MSHTHKKINTKILFLFLRVKLQGIPYKDKINGLYTYHCATNITYVKRCRYDISQSHLPSASYSPSGNKKKITSIYYLLTYSLTPWRRVLLEKLTGLQLVKKFPAFHGIRRFITALTSVRLLSLFWASPIQSIYTHLTS